MEEFKKKYLSGNRMETTYGAVPDSLHNDNISFGDPGSNVKENNGRGSTKAINVGQLSLLDRFLSTGETERETEEIDENELLDGDLDNSLEDMDEAYLLEEDIDEIMVQHEQPINNSTNVEIASSQLNDEAAILLSITEKAADTTENLTAKKGETVIENSETYALSEDCSEPLNQRNNEATAIEIDDHKNNQSSPVVSIQNDSTEPSNEMEAKKADENFIQKSNGATTFESERKNVEKTLQVDRDNDNNLLDEEVGSPRGSENETLTNDIDEKIEQQLLDERDNTNWCENGSVTGNGLDVVEELNHAKSNAKSNVDSNVTNKVESTVEELKDNEASLKQASEEKSCKRKLEHEFSDQRETKRKRVEEVLVSIESVSSSEQAVTDDNKIDVAKNDSNNEANLVTLNTQVEDEITIEGDESKFNKNDDDELVVVGEIKPSRAEKTKIPILGTQAIANDLSQKTVERSNSGKTTGQKEPTTQQIRPVETTKRTQEQSTLILDPPPQKILRPTAFSLDFVQKFRKKFDKMTRNDLEELLLQKCVEAIIHKSDYGDMRNRIEQQENKLQTFRVKYHELSKQYHDLELIHQRVVKDLEIRNKTFVAPAKITRAVGLQVSFPRKEITIQTLPLQVASTVDKTVQQNNGTVEKKRGEVPHKQPVQSQPPQTFQQPQRIVHRSQQQPNNIQNQLQQSATVTPNNQCNASMLERLQRQDITITRGSELKTQPQQGPNSRQQSIPSNNTNNFTTSLPSVIDLTDEDDSIHVVKNGAETSIPNYQGKKDARGPRKVSLSLKSNSPQAQPRMDQQNRLTQSGGGKTLFITSDNNRPIFFFVKYCSSDSTKK